MIRKLLATCLLLLCIMVASVHGNAPAEHDHDHAHAPAPMDDHAGHDHAPSEHDHDDAYAPMDDHAGHDHPPGEHDHAGAPMSMPTAAPAVPSPGSDQACSYHMGKCAPNRAWLSEQLQAPKTWGMCTELADASAGMATGWTCAEAPEQNKTAMGCTDHTILHAMSASMAHNMDVCMPGSLQGQQEAQDYWDAYDQHRACVMNDTMTAMQCSDVAAESIASQLEVLLGQSVPDVVRNQLGNIANSCAEAATAQACAEVSPDMSEAAGTLAEISTGLESARVETENAVQEAQTAIAQATDAAIGLRNVGATAAAAAAVSALLADTLLQQGAWRPV